MHPIIPGIIISYLLGSLPSAYIFGRLLKGIDIRKFGSGNVGATNASRVLGKSIGITVLMLDILKGFIAVAVLINFLALKAGSIPRETLGIVLGFSCILGHNWPVFLKFKGGKGIATTLGVLLGLSINIAGLKLILILSLLTWLVVFIIIRIVSIASVLAAVSLPLYMALFKQTRVLIFFGISLSLLACLRHISNLKRFFQGKESLI